MTGHLSSPAPGSNRARNTLICFCSCRCTRLCIPTPQPRANGTEATPPWPLALCAFAQRLSQEFLVALGRAQVYFMGNSRLAGHGPPSNPEQPTPQKSSAAADPHLPPSSSPAFSLSLTSRFSTLETLLNHYPLQLPSIDGNPQIPTLTLSFNRHRTIRPRHANLD